MNESIDISKSTLESIYKTEEDPVIIIVFSFSIIFIVFLITIYYLILIDLGTSKVDWEKNRCIPKYMFVSGFIQKEENKGIFGSTYLNFKQCVKKFA